MYFDLYFYCLKKYKKYPIINLKQGLPKYGYNVTHENIDFGIHAI